MEVTVLISLLSQIPNYLGFKLLQVAADAQTWVAMVVFNHVAESQAIFECIVLCPELADLNCFKASLCPWHALKNMIVHPYDLVRTDLQASAGLCGLFIPLLTTIFEILSQQT